MNELFNRAAALRIGPATAGAVPLASAVNATAYKGFRITFDIEKTSEGTPNPGTISIYNLAASSRAALEVKGLRMALDVGYSGIGDGDPILGQLFIGDVKKAITKRQGPDIITTLEAGDSETAIRETHIEKSFSEFTTTPQVVATLAQKLGVAVGTIVPGFATLFQNGLTVSGLVSDNLDTITQKLGLEWHVTDGELNILDPTLPTAEPAILLSKATGLVGIPTNVADGRTGQTKDGIEFASLINPGIKPGRAISLVSDAITGVFRARKCHYKGDTHGGDWLVTIEAV